MKVVRGASAMSKQWLRKTQRLRIAVRCWWLGRQVDMLAKRMALP